MGKKYNPFKMWGSYFGVVIGFLSWYLSFHVSSISNSFLGTSLRNFLGSSNMANSMIAIFVFPIIGFLLGWGIHSLIRSMK